MFAIRAAVVLAFVAGSSAHAEGPIVVRAGLGLTGARNWSRDSASGFDTRPTRYGPGFYADVGYRFMDQLAACVHFGITRNSDTSLEGNMGPENDYEVRHVYTPLQLGVGAQWSVARFWLLPWIGVDERALAFGIGAGADVYIDSSGHRIGAYLDAAGSREECTSVVTCGNLYVSAGIAYRYW